MPRRPDWTDIKEGDDVYALLKGVCGHGRQSGSARDYTPPEHEPPRRQPVPPSHDDHLADYRQVKNSRLSGAPDESQPQFAVEKSADLNDVGRVWTRGMSGQSPHPAFDNNDGVVSGARYFGVRHRR